jgi:ferric-dicitrate binding protein FerR (iron transport regulator)
MTDPRLREWLLRWEEGDLTPSELEQLAGLLREDPQARRELRLHSMISSEIEQALHSTAAPVESAFRTRNGFWRRLAVAGLAAAFVGAVLVIALRSRKEPAEFPAASRRVEPEQVGRSVENPKKVSIVRREPGPEPAPSPVLPKEPERLAPPLPETPAPEVPKAPNPPGPAQPEPRPEPRESKPMPSEPKSSPPSAPTVSVLATLERVSGTVFVLSGAERSAAKAAQGIRAGQGLETQGSSAEAVVVYSDLTRLNFGADAALGDFSDIAGGKRLTLGRGMMAVDLATQPEAKPFLVKTAQAELRSVGGYFVLSCDGESTRVDVGSGKVRLMRVQDGRSVEISGGQFAQVASGFEFSPRPLLRADKKKKSKKDLELEVKVTSAVRCGLCVLEEALGDMPVTPSDPGVALPVDLALWAMECGGVPETDPGFQKLLANMLAAELRLTYKVALQALVLEDLDRVKYQNRIAQCAQFLVDNQCRNGQWSYGEPVLGADFAPVGGKVRKENPVSTAATPDSSRGPDSRERKERPKVVQKLAVQKRREGPPRGDNSNSQYAALGLRACSDAGIVLPLDVLKRAQAWWREAQGASKKGDAAGWSYGEAPSPLGRSAYGSMTAGGAGSLVLYHYLLGEPWMRDDAVLKGLDWMARHFTVSENPYPDEAGRKNDPSHFYYLYALERLGLLCGMETFGGHEWYAEGANYLLKVQKPDGSWAPQPDSSRVIDTSLAILFLRRATRPLIDVASVDKTYPK